MIIAPASTGSDNSNSNAVIPTAQTNKGIRSALILIGFKNFRWLDGRCALF